MIIAIESISSRNVKLFANSYAQQFGAKIIEYHTANLYDTILIDKPNLIIVDSIEDNIYHTLFDDIYDHKNINTSTKFLVLNDTNTKHSYSNVKYISSNTYKPYNEYMLPKISESFILCDLNCHDLDINNKLEPILYPNILDMPVRLVNCPQYKNIHNVGIASENILLDLLSRCEIYINTNNTYLYDAIHLNKKVISLITNDMSPVCDKISPDILVSATTIDKSKLNQHKISNLVKYIKL